jgi:glucokinase-like ROK family protein
MSKGDCSHSVKADRPNMALVLSERRDGFGPFGDTTQIITIHKNYAKNVEGLLIQCRESISEDLLKVPFKSGEGMDFPVTGNQQLVKQLNENAVLSILRHHRQLSRSEICRLTKLSHPTVSSLLDSLVEQKRVLPVGHGRSTGGRKPLMFQFNPDAGSVIGVDCGATKVAAGVTNLDGRILYRTYIDRESGPADPYERLLLAIEDVRAHAPPDRPILGIGVGVPGVVDLERGKVTLAPGLEWSDVLLGPRLEEHLQLPVYLENDVNTILLGEHWLGAARGHRHILCIAVGTGIGASLMIGGQLYRGAADAAGEVGYMVTCLEDLRAPTSGYGHLERMAAGPGIAERTRHALAHGRAAPILVNLLPEGRIKRLTAREVGQAAILGDPLCVEVMAESSQILGMAVANMVCLLNPELVVMTGGVMKAGDVIFQPLQEAIRRIVPYDVRIAVSQLREDAGILGAVALVLDAKQRKNVTLQEMEAGPR